MRAREEHHLHRGVPPQRAADAQCEALAERLHLRESGSTHPWAGRDDPRRGGVHCRVGGMPFAARLIHAQHVLEGVERRGVRQGWRGCRGRRRWVCMAMRAQEARHLLLWAAMRTPPGFAHAFTTASSCARSPRGTVCVETISAEMRALLHTSRGATRWAISPAIMACPPSLPSELGSLALWAEGGGEEGAGW